MGMIENADGIQQDTVFITRPIQSKKILNKELGYIELIMRAFTAEARKHFIDDLSSGCINYQSLELKLKKYYESQHDGDIYAGVILDLVRMGVSNAVDKIAVQERENKKKTTGLR